MKSTYSVDNRADYDTRAIQYPSDVVSQLPIPHQAIRYFQTYDKTKYDRDNKRRQTTLGHRIVDTVNNIATVVDPEELQNMLSELLITISVHTNPQKNVYMRIYAPRNLTEARQMLLNWSELSDTQPDQREYNFKLKVPLHSGEVCELEMGNRGLYLEDRTRTDTSQSFSDNWDFRIMFPWGQETLNGQQGQDAYLELYIGSTQIPSAQRKFKWPLVIPGERAFLMSNEIIL
jgi:hypothetical protein